MDAEPSAELRILFRLCTTAHAAFRWADGSPRRGESVGMGADGSPTEEIDRETEARLLSALEAEGVDWDVLSEEAGPIRRGGEKTLVIDPIDGSHNALRRIPFSAISVALGRTDLEGIEIGVVHDLANGVTYWAERGRGAFRDGAPISVRRWDPRSELFLLNLGRHASARAVDWAGRGRRIRSLGCASLELAMVAQGSADAYLFENDVAERNLRVTDIAAGYRLLLEAGGGAARADGAALGPMPLALGQRTTVLAWGDPAATERRSAEAPRP